MPLSSMYAGAIGELEDQKGSSDHDVQFWPETPASGSNARSEGKRSLLHPHDQIL